MKYRLPVSPRINIYDRLYICSETMKLNQASLTATVFVELSPNTLLGSHGYTVSLRNVSKA